MPASWNKEYNPSLLAEKIESTRKVSEDGKVRFEGWGFKEFAVLLYSMLNFGQDVPEIDLRQIVSKAIFNSGAKGIITAKSLLTEVNKLEQEYQKLPTQRYGLASSISINPSLEFHKIHLGNTLIVFEKNLPKRFKQEANNLLRDAKQSLFADPPADYMQVRVHVSAKSIHHGAKQALETLDFVRGVWNWAYNRRHFIRETWGGKSKPVNQIILGPIHTLHNSNGYLAATNNWWYEPS